MELCNEMEAIVFSKVDDIIRNEPHISCCPQCRMDVVAIALNHLPPRYVVTEKGRIFAKVSMLDQQFGADVLSAIVRAIEMVKEHPRHELTVCNEE